LFALLQLKYLRFTVDIDAKFDVPKSMAKTSFDCPMPEPFSQKTAL
jgi:hypothetical protein